MKFRLQLVLSFLIATVGVCIANFVIQVLLIFTDIVTRWESTSVSVIVLWIVTGVFGAVFGVAMGDQLTGKRPDIYKQTGNTILLVSLVAIAIAVYLLSQGHFKKNPKEFSLILSNGYVFLSYFVGSGGMSLILRNLD